MTMILHHHMLEEQVRQHTRELEALNREAWKLRTMHTNKPRTVLSGLTLMLGLLGRWR
ncbi:hypothetical protein [Cohnella sp. 56]|uniref:hypothetical protein n=1 Tax=Cohnella sp. 56 TaxID=3113722 RepID=UPI0030E99522